MRSGQIDGLQYFYLWKIVSANEQHWLEQWQQFGVFFLLSLLSFLLLHFTACPKIHFVSVERYLLLSVLLGWLSHSKVTQASLSSARP
jgi:ABC-type microcin C transport system permease subunit YejE